MSKNFKSLYEKLITASKNFKDYNFRMYFCRINEEDFGKFVNQEEIPKGVYREIEDRIGLMERQSAIQNMYNTMQNIMEVTDVAQRRALMRERIARDDKERGEERGDEL